MRQHMMRSLPGPKSQARILKNPGHLAHRGGKSLVILTIPNRQNIMTYGMVKCEVSVVVAKLAAARDLESRVERRVGANPTNHTIYYYVSP